MYSSPQTLKPDYRPACHFILHHWIHFSIRPVGNKASRQQSTSCCIGKTKKPHAFAATSIPSPCVTSPPCDFWRATRERVRSLSATPTVPGFNYYFSPVWQKLNRGQLRIPSPILPEPMKNWTLSLWGSIAPPNKAPSLPKFKYETL